MSLNQVMKDARFLSVACTAPAAPASGAPVRYGLATGVAVAAEAADGNTVVDFGQGIYRLSVTDAVGGGIAVGDAIFLADGPPVALSNTSTGFFFGFAMAAIGAGLTATIDVLHVQSPGAGTLGAGTVGAANLAAGAARANLTATPARSSELAETTIQYAEVALTNANIKNLRATPIQLVAAPAAGKVLEFVSATLLLDYGSNVLTRPNADEDMVVKYENGAGPVASEATAAGFPVANADQVCVLGKAATATMTAAATVAKALVLHNDGSAEFGGNAANDTLLRVKVAYRVHTTGF